MKYEYAHARSEMRHDDRASRQYVLLDYTIPPHPNCILWQACVHSDTPLAEEEMEPIPSYTVQAKTMSAILPYIPRMVLLS